MAASQPPPSLLIRLRTRPIMRGRLSGPRIGRRMARAASATPWPPSAGSCELRGMLAPNCPSLLGRTGATQSESALPEPRFFVDPAYSAGTYGRVGERPVRASTHHRDRLPHEGGNLPVFTLPKTRKAVPKPVVIVGVIKPTSRALTTSPCALSNQRVPYEPRLDRILVYFGPQVLAPYREQPDKYRVVTDQFEGRVALTDTYYMQLDEVARKKEAIDVRFGYRTLKNGELRIAAFGPDLLTKSQGHVSQWMPLRVQADDWLDYNDDERFSSWVRRYIKADWGVDNGPVFYLLEEIKLINGLTAEAVGCSLYKIDDATISFPTAQNTHRYEDAHRDLYGLLIDGLNKPCIQQFAVRLGRSVDTPSMRPLIALKNALPSLKANAIFEAPLENVSKQRGLASHGVRAPAKAKAMRAFEGFSRDVESCLQAYRILRTTLETELKMDAKHSRERQEALGHLPRITVAPSPNYSINQARDMVGKTVEEVEVGSRQQMKGCHQTEAIIIHFTDGSIMSVHAGCNAGNFDCDKHPPETFHVDFIVQWVPTRP